MFDVYVLLLLQMVILCFAMCVGCWGIISLKTTPFTATPEVSSFAVAAASLAPPLCLSSSDDPYATPAKRSRLLLSFLDERELEKPFASSSDSFGVETAAPSHVTSQNQRMQNASSTTFQAYIKPLNASA
uniref:Uncharacterized protein n=1 Tax=Strigamia maritima TaxID=126957 RepID=T1JM73_STRMM